MVVEELHPDLRVALQKVRGRRNFQVDEWIDKKTDLFNEYMSKHKLKACLVNLSGGVDSAVTLALMVAASKKSNSPIQRVLGISQPIHSTGMCIKFLFPSFIYNDILSSTTAGAAVAITQLSLLPVQYDTIRYNTTTTVTKKNRDHLEKSIRMWREVGC